MKTLLSSLFLTLICLYETSAQEFKYILDEQLSSKLIADIYQDSNGFIWISTDNGLNRFDGNKVKSYNHNENDSLSLCHNIIVATFEDHNKNIYVGNYLGIQLYNHNTDKFSQKATRSNGETFEETVNGFCELPDGTVCSYGDNTWKITIKNGQPITEELDWDFNTSSVYRVACDNQNNIWALKRDVGLYKIRNGKSRLVLDYRNNQSYIFDFRIIDGMVYIVSVENDIYIYDVDTESAIKVNNGPVSKASIRDIIQYDENNLLVCTDGNGFKIVNRITGEVSEFYLNIPLLTSNHLKIHKAIRDQFGNLWLGLYQKGVAVISATQNAFGYIGYKSLLNNIIGNSTTSAISKDKTGNIWVGTDGDGIYRMNIDATESVHFPSHADGGSAPSIIKSVFADSEGDVWFGTYGNGIGKIASKQNRYESYENVFTRGGKITTRVYDIAEDGDKRLWVASLGAGTFCYDLKKKQIINELSFWDEINKWQTSLLYTSGNKLYVGTFDGIFEVNLNPDSITTQQLTYRNVINCLYEDSWGNIWAGDSNGLVRISKDGTITYFSEDKGLPNVSVNSINESSNNSLWLATDKGLINYYPEDGRCFRYTTNDGLQNMEFAKAHSFTDVSGRLWFAGDYGISFFKPLDLVINKNKRSVRILDFLINNESITTETLSNGRPIIDQPVFLSNTFNLSRANNSFAIEFGTYELDTPNFVEYKYSINGDQWHSLQPGSKRAYFNNLRTGTYYIRYKLVDNLIESDVQEIKVVISPYWWLSKWAIIGYIILFIIIAIYLFNQVRYQYLVQQRHERHQRAIEINEAKLQFFTNISHDIKTPLSLIVSPLQKLINTDDDPKRQVAYKTMYRNSKMLIQLINELLDLRKIDNGRLKMTFQKADIVSRLFEMCSYFDVIAEEKNIRFSFQHEAEELLIWIDPVYFDKIIMNILSNAFKYTPNDGTVTISLKTVTGENGKEFAHIEVKDNGIGIQDKDLRHIFDRFYIAENNKEKGNSNGIGLHLTRSLVGLHHGTIKAMNNGDAPGACFIVELPLGRDHFRKDETLLDTEADNIKTESIDFPIEKDTTDIAKSQSTNTLLIVDDDPEILNYLRNELSQDFHIETCNNGKDALQMVFNKQPNLIISDIMMPEMDGITFCKKIKQNVNFNHIPIILLTAKSDETTNLQGLKYGADAYVTKPFYIEILRRTALNLVNLRSQLHNIYTGQQTQEERQVKIEMQSPNQKLLDRIMKVVNANISNPDLSIDMLCEEVGISRAHIYRKLKELTNQSGRDFIRNIRLKYAENLLLEDRYSIGEIAEKVGFSKASNFSSAFKEKYGLPPYQWREAQRNKE